MEQHYSSLFFIISTIHSIKTTQQLTWKMSNALLLIGSYLCNAYPDEHTYMMLDYFSICSMAMSYANNPYISMAMTGTLALEYNQYNTIEKTKTAAFILALTTSFYNTQLILKPKYTIIYLVASTIGISAYVFRSQKPRIQNPTIYSHLTTIFHTCVTTTTILSSLTKQKS